MKNLQHIAKMKKLIITTLLMLPIIAFSQTSSYLWSTGDTTATISPSPLVTTTYYVTVTQYSVAYYDSITIVVNNPSSSNAIISNCGAYTWPVNGVNYTTSGAYSDTLINAVGCDSVVTLNLTINQSSTGSENITACNTYTWPANNQTYTSSGAYTSTLTNVAGCDSVVTLNLTINQSFTASETITAVQTYTWPTNNQTYTSSGAYTATLSNSIGCDSVITLNLTIAPPLVLTTTATDTVICEGSSVTVGINAVPDTSTSNNTTSFNIRVRTTNSGVSGNNQFQLTGAQGEYNVEAVHITTGNIETFNGLINEQTLTFSNGPGDYLLKVFPTGSTPFNRIRFVNTGDKKKLIEVTNWGNINWSNWESMFADCDNMKITATDIPNLSNVANMSGAFYQCSSLNGPLNIGNWDVSSVTNMSEMFRECLVFNQPLGNWDVSNVTAMQNMFWSADSFNQPINTWDVSSVTNMAGMFGKANSFNQDIGSWNVSSVTNMSGLAIWTQNFNSDISSWDVSNVTSLRSTFLDAKAFNQDISSWDVSNVTDMNSTFTGASSFNQDISSWDVSSVIDMSRLFTNASLFNQDISSWDVSNVSDMWKMFSGAISFNQDLSNWCVPSISVAPTNFSSGSALTANQIPNWGTCPAQYPAGIVHCDPNNPTAVVDVTNPITGKTWMDRNLGASQAAQSPTDTLAYGDLYQWGRGADGHQCRNSDTIMTISTTIYPSHGSFIVGEHTALHLSQTGCPYLWQCPQDDNLWQGANGINNPCPIGYRLPTEIELEEERLSWNQNNSSGAFSSPLKFALAGYRQGDGAIIDLGTSGIMRSSSLGGNLLRSSQTLNFSQNSASSGNLNSRTFGFSVRCIKD